MDLPLWLVVVLLGLIEGLTEFIPVSSTGHLLIAEHWLPRQSDLFNIVIQCGAVLAVLPLFRRRLAMLSHWREPKSQALLTKIFVAFFITGVGGLLLDHAGFKLPETIAPVATALIVGGTLFIAVDAWLKNRPVREEIGWTTALLVAAAQLAAAVFPGSSRSGATILVAMLLGSNRVVATEFSFLVGIPTLLAAGAYKILKALHGGVDENWNLLLLGTITAAVVSFIAVRWLLRYIEHHTFAGFGWYRIGLGGLLLILAALHVL